MGHQFDAIIGIGGCDKTIPGTVMPMARMNIPSVFVYGGTILPGVYRGRDVDIISAFEAVGAFSAGKIDEEERAGIERAAIPCQGACGGMYTANTMASAVEALGMALPGNSSHTGGRPAQGARSARPPGETVIDCLRRGLKPRDIMTREAFLNAIRIVMALGGSTNAVLHLLAIAHEAEGGPDHRRLQPDRREHADPGRPEARRALRDEGSGPRGRGADGDAHAARRRSAARRLHHRHRAHHRRKPGRRGGAPGRAGRGVSGGQAVQGERRHSGDQGQPGAGGRGAEVVGRQGAPPPRPGARVRRRGGRPAGDPHGAGEQGATCW